MCEIIGIIQKRKQFSLKQSSKLSEINSAGNKINRYCTNIHCVCVCAHACARISRTGFCYALCSFYTYSCYSL